MASTIDSINATISGMKTLLTTNKTSIGNITDVLERDEYPQVVLETGKPVAYIIPMMDGPDIIDSTMGKPGISYHEFPVDIMAFYRMNNVAEDLLTVRGYGFNAYDIFKANNNISGGVFHQFELEFGYFTVVDYIIHWWLLKLYVKKYVNTS
jgi:hypothetical protein